jgi:hypothetical protein
MPLIKLQDMRYSLVGSPSDFVIFFVAFASVSPAALLRSLMQLIPHCL